MRYIVVIENEKNIEILSKIIRTKELAKSQLNKIKKRDETMFRNYKKAKIFKLVEVDERE